MHKGGSTMKQFPVYDTVGEAEGRWRRLSLGGGVTVATEDILGIFDMDTATVTPVTKKFLNHAQKMGCVSPVGDELPKSFVVIQPRNKCTPGRHAAQNNTTTEQSVVLSQFTPSTLCGRDGHL